MAGDLKYQIERGRRHEKTGALVSAAVRAGEFQALIAGPVAARSAPYGKIESHSHERPGQERGRSRPNLDGMRPLPSCPVRVSPPIRHAKNASITLTCDGEGKVGPHQGPVDAGL